MGKSSSSSKKIKPSKDSSKLRSVNKKKKKSKRSKSKKMRRVKDYSDESESTSGSDSSLYSSSDDDYRRQKRRSKVSKKRSRKRYSSSESDDDDDDARLLKKKKRSKRKDEHVGTKKKKKKISSRKRRKRDSSSDSSDDGSDSDGKRRIKDRGRLGKVKDTRTRSKNQLEEDSEPDDECWQVEDEVMTEKNPPRLKSIIVVSCSYDKDERKEDSGDRELGHSEESDYGNGGETVGYDEFGEDNKSETSKDDDLEAILKKRALENLKRFRGETEKSGIASKEVSSVTEGELSQIGSEKTESQDRGLMEEKKLCVNVSESRTTASQQSGDTVKVTASSGIIPCSSKRKLIRPLLGQESCLNLASGKETAGCEDAEAESINGGTIDNDYPVSSLAVATRNGDETIEPTKASSTLNAQSSSHADTDALGKIRGESQSEQKTSDETKDESQYEQKTMTVMRGGEMVQVSYKVYIPKKTSALGRRNLQR